jgi:hypothetical protein
MTRKLSYRIIVSFLASLMVCGTLHAEAPPNKAPRVGPSTLTQPVVIYDAEGNVVNTFGGTSNSTNIGITRIRTVCTLPSYSAGGTATCTQYNTDGTSTVTNPTCAINTACLISAANTNRKTAEFTNRTANSTIDIGYSSSVSPGTGKGYDGPSITNGQGGSGSENPAHVGSYFAATATAGAVLVFIQGQ